MRTLGLLGGFTWHSTAAYYERIQQRVAERMDPLRSAPVLVHSMDYGELVLARRTGNWKRFGRRLVAAGRGLQRAGAEGLVICSNTMHRFVPQLESQVSVPVLHIADALADAAEAQGVETVGLLGTAFTLRQRFYRDHLEARGLRVVVPDPPTIDLVDHVLLGHLARGVVLEEDKEPFVAGAEAMASQGAQAAALACTEIGMLIGEGDLPLPLLDTTTLHAEAAADWSMG